MADSDDDELFKFASFKPSAEEEQSYHNSLLKDIEDEDEDYVNSSYNSRKRPIPEGLAAQLVSGITKRRRTSSSDEDDDLLSPKKKKASKRKYKPRSSLFCYFSA